VRDNFSENIYQEEQINVLNELFRVMKPGSSFFYNHKTRWDKGEMIHPMQWLLKTKWTVRQEIIWDRILAANIRGWRFWQVDERIYWLYKPINDNKIGEELKSKHALLTSIWRFPPERNNNHPAPFPIVLPARVIYSILNENNGMVIDPYMGSGSTAVAAKLLGKKYFGIDLSLEYIKQAEDRIKNCLIEKDIVDKEIANHFVEKTFSQRKDEGLYIGKNENNIKNTKFTTQQNLGFV
jgi:modification methylase